MTLRILLCFAFILAAIAGGQAQTNQPIRIWDPPHNCSELKIVGPEEPVAIGVPVKLELKAVGGPEEQRLKYSWEVSDGIISSGQGTPVITVETYNLANRSASAITATVMARGVPPECNMQARYTIHLQNSAAVPADEIRCGLGPMISVSCPTDVIQPGGQATVSGNVSGGDPYADYTYNWEVSAGKIVAGQGTSTITIEVTDGQTTATLKVGGKGMPIESNNTASCTFAVYSEPETRRVTTFESQAPVKDAPVPAKSEEQMRADQIAAHSCPSLVVECPSEPPGLDGKPSIKASVPGEDPSRPIYFSWSLSSGKIVSGRDASTITIAMDNDDPANWADVTTATVEISGPGIGADCPRTASCTFMWEGCKAIPRKFDGFGRMKPSTEAERLENLVIELENNPTAQGYIIVYRQRGHAAREAKNWTDRTVNYLVERHIEAGRIITVDGEPRAEPSVELWIVPQGATPPIATPESPEH